MYNMFVIASYNHKLIYCYYELIHWICIIDVFIPCMTSCTFVLYLCQDDFYIPMRLYSQWDLWKVK
jgi:hypothetical protein